MTLWYLQSHAYCSLQSHCPLAFSLFCKASYSSTETFGDPEQPTWKQRHVRMLPWKDDWWTATRVVYSKQNTSSEDFQKKTTHTDSLQNAADTDHPCADQWPGQAAGTTSNKEPGNTAHQKISVIQWHGLKQTLKKTQFQHPWCGHRDLHYPFFPPTGAMCIFWPLLQL